MSPVLFAIICFDVVIWLYILVTAFPAQFEALTTTKIMAPFVKAFLALTDFTQLFTETLIDLWAALCARLEAFASRKARR